MWDQHACRPSQDASCTFERYWTKPPKSSAQGNIVTGRPQFNTMGKKNFEFLRNRPICRCHQLCGSFCISCYEDHRRKCFGEAVSKWSLRATLADPSDRRQRQPFYDTVERVLLDQAHFSVASWIHQHRPSLNLNKTGIEAIIWICWTET